MASRARALGANGPTAALLSGFVVARRGAFDVDDGPAPAAAGLAAWPDSRSLPGMVDPHTPLIPPQHLLVPVDVGLEERAATELLVDAAAALARVLADARITLLHVAPPIQTTMAPAPLTMPPPGYAELIAAIAVSREAMQDTLRALAARAASRGQVPVETELLEHDGRVADSIVAFASERRADLILLTSHSRHGLPKVLLGSVAERAARASTVPVLIIPHRAHPAVEQP